MPRPRSARDRHGRGTRRGLVPAYAQVAGRRVRIPAYAEGRDRLSAVAGRVLQPLVERWGEELGGLAVQVEDVPPEAPGPADLVVADTGDVALAHARPGQPSRVVVYRRPLELRAEDDVALQDLVHEVVVEAVALLLGREPDEVDPGPQG